MTTTIEEKLWVLQEKLKETDGNLTTCIVLLQQYLRQEQYGKENNIKIVFVAFLALALAKEDPEKKVKRGVFDLGYGISSPSIISAAAPLSITAPAPILRTASSYAAPIPAFSYASPAVSYAAPAVSYAAPALSYAAPALSYAAPAVSYAAPAVSYTAPAISYGGVPALSYSAPAPLSYATSAPTSLIARSSSSSLVGYPASASLLARSVVPAHLSLGYSSTRGW